MCQMFLVIIACKMKYCHEIFSAAGKRTLQFAIRPGGARGDLVLLCVSFLLRGDYQRA
jgi:hypothetical protein